MQKKVLPSNQTEESSAREKGGGTTGEIPHGSGEILLTT